MSDDIVKRVIIRYDTEGLAGSTRVLQTYNKELNTLKTTHQKFIANASGTSGVWTKTSENIKMNANESHRLSGALNSVMLRYIGLTAVLGHAERGFREMQQWVKESIDAFREFEVRMKEVESIVDATGKALGPSFTAGIKEMSMQFGVSVNDLTKGLYEIISAAVPAEDSMNLLNVSVKASIAGLTDVKTTTDTFTTVLNSYNMTVANAARVSDILFEAVIRGKFVFEDLANALGYVVPIAANVGVSLEEVAAALSTVTRQGQHIDIASRGLALLLQNIVNPTKEASEAAIKYGVDLSATALQINGLTGVMDDLREATQKYGMQILPELVGNMRSLRVAMVLTGDKGAAGFAEDLGLMETATGRTDNALQQLMSTQQKLNDMMEQSLELLNREIGETWSTVDIQWKKIQLWWKTAFATAFFGADINANEIVSQYDNTVKAMRESYLENLIKSGMNEEPTFFQQYQEYTGEAFENFIAQADTYKKVSEYISRMSWKTSLSEQAEAALNAAEAFETLNTITDKVKSRSAGGVPLRKTTTLAEAGVTENTIAYRALNNELQKLGWKQLNLNMTLEEYDRIQEGVNNQLNGATKGIEDQTEKLEELQKTYDDFKSALESSESAIEGYKNNIISLKSEISGLEEKVESVYKTMTSTDLAGTLGYDIKVFKAETQMDRFQEYSDMAARFGEEYINEYTDVFDEYGNSIAQALMTMHDWVEATEEAKNATDEFDDSLKDIEIQMMRNNLQILKFELIGMIRRRGNTRAEMRAIKKLEIDNTKLRIQQMQIQLTQTEQAVEEETDVRKTAYDEAKQIVDDYLALEQYKLWVMKDNRDQELQDMIENYNSEKSLLSQRRADLLTQYTELQSAEEKFYLALQAINDKIGPEWADFFGISAIDVAKEKWQDYLDFVKANPVPTGASTPATTGPASSTYATQTGGYVPLSVKELWLKKFSRGSWSVPETGPYILHKYEQVRSSNAPDATSGQSSTVNININNPTVNNEADVARLARSLENVVRSNLIDKRSGKTKYRMS